MTTDRVEPDVTRIMLQVLYSFTLTDYTIDVVQFVMSTLLWVIVIAKLGNKKTVSHLKYLVPINFRTRHVACRHTNAPVTALTVHVEMSE